jgi:hypothetical protein
MLKKDMPQEIFKNTKYEESSFKLDLKSNGISGTLL